MAAGLQPGSQPHLGGGEPSIRDTHLIEAERPAPRLDIRSEAGQVFLPARKIIVFEVHPRNDSGPSARLHLPDEDATLAAGARLATALPPRLTILLRGDLGAGKTTLVRGLLRALGHAGTVKSPTYTLVEPYQLQDWRLFHWDLYRLADAEELEFLGLRDQLDGEAALLIEWPERGQGELPAADLIISLGYAGAGRAARLEACSPRGAGMLTQL